MPPAENIKTRFLILSDTHGLTFDPRVKLPKADVAIHCGDLTDASLLEEFHPTIRLLRDLDAPLKLVIPGNHDLTLDTPLFQRKAAELSRHVDVGIITRQFGECGQARRLFDDEDVREAGIVFLDDEGVHRFTLGNGAALTVYASPWTPSLGDWGFQYRRNQGHEYEIDRSVDVVMTHGPPGGVLDVTETGRSVGSAELFRAVARARPRMHCFGHIHEAWGARLVVWRDSSDDEDDDGETSHSGLPDIDNEKSVVLKTLEDLKASPNDTPETRDAKSKKREKYTSHGYCVTSHCSADSNPIDDCGGQTLFVNASIQGDDDYPMQLPWLVDIELCKAE